MKYKIGDEVITRWFDGASPTFVKAMAFCIGRRGRITNIHSALSGYTVHGWWWPESALELVSEKKAPALDLTKPVQTTHGQPIRILCTDAPNAGYPLVGMFPSGDIGRWTADGKHYTSGGLALINVPEKPKSATRVVVMTRSGGVAVSAAETIAAARLNFPGAIAFKEVTITEGEGV